MDIIELRQANASLSPANGDYEVSLDDGLLLNPGDELLIKNCFVDTKNINDNEIVLNSDYTFHISTIRCVKNIDDTDKAYGNNNNGDITKTDNKYYMECVNVGAIIPNLELISNAQISIKEKLITKDRIANITFSYLDINGNKATKSVKVDRNNYTVSPGPLPLNIIAKKNTIKLIQDKNWKSLKMNFDGFTRSDYSDTHSYKPITNTFDFTLPAGNYTLERFQEEFNKKITVLSTTNTEYLDSPLLTYTTNEGGGLSKPFIRVDGNGYFKFQNLSGTKQYFVGTNQFAIEFDEELQFWEIINHFPLYENNNIEVRFKNFQDYVSGVSTNIKQAYGSYGTVLITNLTATDGDGLEQNFFGDVLGFDMSKIISHIGYKTDNLNGVPNQIIPYMDSSSIEIGVNVSDALFSIDDIVSKGGTGFRTINPSTINSIKQINSTFRPIYSSFKFNELKNNAYYLIEIDGFNTSLSGGAFKVNNIAGILSAYYAVGSYTTSGQESSIPMVYNGITPTLIKSFKVRILNPDRSVVDDLGNDNCVFLQHIKAKN